MRFLLAILLFAPLARADLATRCDRPVPKLVAPPHRTVSSQWKRVGSDCVLDVTLSGSLHIGAMNDYVSVGDICPGTTQGGVESVVVRFHHVFPKDGDRVKMTYGMAPACSVRDTFFPAASPLVEGSCTGAQPSGPPEQFTHVVMVRETGARVRSRPIFAKDEPNVLGKLPAAATLFAQGPLKNAEFSDGVGWAVLLVDPQRHVCRGYVSASVVTQLE